MALDGIDRATFRQALGTFVTGVTIVTTRAADGRPIGLTANSFNSVSLNPPLVLWSLALDSANLPAFREAETWAVHVLAAGQEDLSSRFASRGSDKFAGVDHHDGPGGVPLLDGCAARFVCRSTFEYEGGDHAIFVGQVIDLMLAPTTPLIFHGGRYGRVLPGGARAAPPEDEREYGRYFTGHLLGLAHNAAFAEVRREYRQRGLRSSEYTVVTALGLGDGCSCDELIARAARGGVDLPRAAIDRLIERGEIVGDEASLNLTQSGRRTLTELTAVAQSAQLKLDARLNPQEMAHLHLLLERLSAE